MRKRTFFIALCFWVALACFAVSPVSDERAAALSVQFRPPTVTANGSPPNSDGYLEETIQDPLEEIRRFDGHLRYLAFSMPGDTSQYLLLGWGAARDMYWRLLKSTDGGTTYSIYQDAPYWIPAGDSWHFRLQDLTNDGVPEILIEDDDLTGLDIFAWRAGRMVSITPFDEAESPLGGKLPEGEEGFGSGNGVYLEDLDGDHVAEVVVNADSVDEPDENGSYTPRYVSPTRIYRYNGTSYVLWKEIPWSDDDPFPVHVPDIAVCHPGTIPLTELSSSGKGDLQIFVGHPGAKNTVDDIDTASLAFQGAPLSFKKRWANQKQPDTTSANWEWEGCPVKQTASSGQGEWNPSPEDPFLPSPDGKTEYHFVAPYLEFRLARSAVFPYLLQQAQAAFAKEPNRPTYFIEIPVSGKMKNGKLAAVSALVCIKNTGNPAKASAPEAVAAPAKGK